MRWSKGNVEIENSRTGVRFNEYREEVRAAPAQQGQGQGQDRQIGQDGFDVCGAYLECVEGEDFIIRLKYTNTVAPAEPAFRIDVADVMILVDGRPLQPDIWTLRKYDTYSKSTFFSADEGGRVYTTNLSFAPLEKTDEEDQVELRGPKLDPLCKIEVQVQRGTAYRCGSMKYQTSKKSVGVVHEKQLKLSSTIVGKQSVEVGDHSETSCDFRPGPQPEVCKFVWTYRNRDRLCIMGIIDDQEGAARPALAATGSTTTGTQLVKREREEEAGNGDDHGAGGQRKKQARDDGRL